MLPMCSTLPARMTSPPLTIGKSHTARRGISARREARSCRSAIRPAQPRNMPDRKRQDMRQKVVCPVRRRPQRQLVISIEVEGGVLQVVPDRGRRKMVRQVRQRVEAHRPDGNQLRQCEYPEDGNEKATLTHVL